MHFRTPAFILLTAVLLALLFWAFRPDGQVRSLPSTATPENFGGDAEPALIEKLPPTYRITLSQGKRIAGPELISAAQGEALNIEFVSDQDNELHLHGYDIKLQLAKGETARLSFTATHAGRFEYELHRHSEPLRL